MTRITIEVSEEQKREMKILATLSDLTLKDLIIDRTIGLEPNEETIQSFKDYKNNKVSKHKDFNSFINDLEN